MAQAKATIDHGVIKEWVQQRGGCPARVKGTGNAGSVGILRVDYTGFSGQQSLEKVSWKAFLEAFEKNKLAFLYQDDPASRFSKLVSRDHVQLEESGSGRRQSNGASAKKKTNAGKKPIDAIELLTHQHREVEELFDKLENAKGASQKGRLFTKLADSLAAHSKIEETIFYPAAFSEATEMQLREAVEEHLVAKRLIADLLKMDPSDAQFMSKVTVLRESIKHHIEEEEQELFEQVRSAEHDDLNVLGQHMQEQYKELMRSAPSKQVPKETRSAAIQF